MEGVEPEVVLVEGGLGSEMAAEAEMEVAVAVEMVVGAGAGAEVVWKAQEAVKAGGSQSMLDRMQVRHVWHHSHFCLGGYQQLSQCLEMDIRNCS